MKRSRARSASLPRRLHQQAAELAALLPSVVLHGRALAALRAQPPQDSVAVACSGGADSVALLLLLWAHFPERRGQWLVLHFDHGLRGAASAADATFVQNLARTLGERCVMGRWKRAGKQPHAKVSEAEAREARWTFFSDAMREHGARVIVLGHQLNDIAETMLMRLARGSGSGGLAAPRPVQRRHDGTTRVRPLLNLSAAVIRGALERCGIGWREDATNATDDFFRNRVRRHVLPALESAAAGRDVLRASADARELFEEDDAALVTWLEQIAPQPPRAEVHDLATLRGQPAALARRAVYRWIRALGLAEPAKAVVDQLVEAIVRGSTHRSTLGVGIWAGVSHGQLRLLATEGDRGATATPVPGWPAVRLKPGETLTGPRGDHLSLQHAKLTPTLFRTIRAGVFPHETVAYLDPGTDWPGWFEVRAWRPGDRYRPIGAPGRAKLQDLFVNRGVPRELRRLLPVVLNRYGSVIWVPGLPIAEEVAIQPTGKLVVQLTYGPVPPMVNRSKAPTLTDVRSRKA